MRLRLATIACAVSAAGFVAATGSEKNSVESDPIDTPQGEEPPPVYELEAPPGYEGGDTYYALEKKQDVSYDISAAGPSNTRMLNFENLIVEHFLETHWIDVDGSPEPIEKKKIVLFRTDSDPFPDIFNALDYQLFCKKYAPEIERFSKARGIVSAYVNCVPEDRSRDPSIPHESPNDQMMISKFLEVVMLVFSFKAKSSLPIPSFDDINRALAVGEHRYIIVGGLRKIQELLSNVSHSLSRSTHPKAYYAALATMYRLLFTEHTFVEGNIADPYEVLTREFSKDDKGLSNIIRGFSRVLEGGNLLKEDKKYESQILKLIEVSIKAYVYIPMMLPDRILALFRESRKFSRKRSANGLKN